MNKLKPLQVAYEGKLFRNTSAVVLASLALAGCGDSSSSQTKETSQAPAPAATEPATGPSGQTPKDYARSVAKLSRDYRGKNNDVPAGFCESTNNNPQRMYSRHPAKLIVNSLCQPPLGEPVGVYKSSSFHSESVGKINDGDIVTAHCIDKSGQETTNVTGPGSASETWVKISKGNIEGMVSEVNLGYVNDALFKEC
jgi:hypothetical protein